MFYIREIKRIFALSLDVRTNNVIPRDKTVQISAFIALHDVEGSRCIKNLVFLSFLIGCLNDWMPKVQYSRVPRPRGSGFETLWLHIAKEMRENMKFLFYEVHILFMRLYHTTICIHLFFMSLVFWSLGARRKIFPPIN